MLDKLLCMTFLKSLWQNGKEKSDMLEAKFYDTVDDSLLKFAVIISQSNDNIRIQRQKSRANGASVNCKMKIRYGFSFYN